jgi:hypothetical protein
MKWNYCLIVLPSYVYVLRVCNSFYNCMSPEFIQFISNFLFPKLVSPDQIITLNLFSPRRFANWELSTIVWHFDVNESLIKKTPRWIHTHLHWLGGLLGLSIITIRCVPHGPDRDQDIRVRKVPKLEVPLSICKMLTLFFIFRIPAEKKKRRPVFR